MEYTTTLLFKLGINLPQTFPILCVGCMNTAQLIKHALVGCVVPAHLMWNAQTLDLNGAQTQGLAGEKNWMKSQSFDADSLKLFLNLIITK